MDLSIIIPCYNSEKYLKNCLNSFCNQIKRYNKIEVILVNDCSTDGTSKIWIIEPDTLEEIDFIQVTTNKSIISKINEMEWINGKIYANTYQFNKDIILIIDPETGSVEGVVDFNGLKKKVKNHSKIDVLNGIAYKKNSKTIFITGKNWNKLFELQIIEK